MRIYDISQEIVHCRIYPGDEGPSLQRVQEIDRGDACNLTVFRMCAHNGTHVDAPLHFFAGGKGINRMGLAGVIGMASVVTASGELDARAIRQIRKGRRERLLIRGDAVITLEGAEELASGELLLVGTQSQTVGPFDAPGEVHTVLLGKEIVLLEGLELQAVPDGDYFLFAAPINLGSADGAPCRAILISPRDLLLDLEKEQG